MNNIIYNNSITKFLNSKLEEYVISLAKTHSPFKRDKDNQHYQDKYVEIFQCIFGKLTNIDDSVSISQPVLQDIYRNYKQVLFDLYNDSLIYFCLSKGKSLIHGNIGFSKEFKGEYNKSSFKCFYKLDNSLIQQLKDFNSSTDSFNNILVHKKLLNYSTLFKQNKKQYRTNRTDNKQMNITPNEQQKFIIKLEKEVKMTENKWYLELTDKRGNKVMDKLPHYGEYEDGRIYSRFHSMKRMLREELLLCGKPIKEVFDISHCFSTLLGILIKTKLSNDKVKEYFTYIMNNDIYTDALKAANIEVTKENRNAIKPYFNKFILSTIKDNKRNMKWRDKTNDPEIFSAVVNFFKNSASCKVITGIFFLSKLSVSLSMISFSIICK